LEGSGEIVATDNGDATCFEPFQSHERDAFNGLAVAIVRAKAGQPGTLRLNVKSDGLEEAHVKITSR
jgi:beta-galactosidase